MAPEAQGTDFRKCTRESDIFGLGRVLLDIFIGKNAANPRLMFHSDCPSVIATVIKKCCDPNPKKRPDILSLVRFFQVDTVRYAIEHADRITLIREQDQ